MIIGNAGILRIILFVMGVALLGITVGSLAKRKLNESFSLVWGIISVALIVMGIIISPVEWNEYISTGGLFLILVIMFSIVYAAYFTSIRISQLTRENTELAIQVSLLNQENQRILNRLKEMTGLEIRDI
jgi:hypothetical protein